MCGESGSIFCLLLSAAVTLQEAIKSLRQSRPHFDHIYFKPENAARVRHTPSFHVHGLVPVGMPFSQCEVLPLQLSQWVISDEKHQPLTSEPWQFIDRYDDAYLIASPISAGTFLRCESSNMRMLYIHVQTNRANCIVQVACSSAA